MKRKILNFYMDDSGSRHLDKRARAHARIQPEDCFALGGVLIAEDDVDIVNEKHALFCEKWKIFYPLHSYEIRNKCGNFSWLMASKAKCVEFWTALEQFLITLPVHGIACVIDRPGYDVRYKERYGHNRWSLCKSAFSISVERAAKYASKKGMKLRILPERCSPTEDDKLEEHYKCLIQSASPFNPTTSAKYAPLASLIFKDVLHEFRLKNKTSPLIQIADLFLWPMCKGGYDGDYHAYRALKKANRFLDCLYEETEIAELGIKYFCFDDSEFRNTKALKTGLEAATRNGDFIGEA